MELAGPLGTPLGLAQRKRASSRGEAKDSALLSSRDAGLLEPPSGLKGVQPPFPFGERTRDCSPGHARKEGPQLARLGASQGFPRAAAPVGVFSCGTTRTSGSLLCGAREVRSPCAWRGGALHCSRVHGRGLGPRDALKDSMSFSGGGGKPSFPSPSAGDLRELSRVPLRSE